jgi:hypothetical protein
MNQTELKTRIETYKKALVDGRITGKEYYGFIEALKEMAAKR